MAADTHACNYVRPLWLSTICKVVENGLIYDLSLNEHKNLSKIMTINIINSYVELNNVMFTLLKDNTPEKEEQIRSSHFTLIRECNALFAEYYYSLCEWNCKTKETLKIFEHYLNVFTNIKMQIRKLETEFDTYLRENDRTYIIYNRVIYDSVLLLYSIIVESKFRNLKENIDNSKLRLSFQTLTERYSSKVDEYGSPVPIPVSEIRNTFTTEFNIDTKGYPMPMTLETPGYTLPKLPHKQDEYTSFKTKYGIIYTCKEELTGYVDELREKYGEGGVINEDEYNQIIKDLDKVMVPYSKTLPLKYEASFTDHQDNKIYYKIDVIIKFIQQNLMNRTYFSYYGSLGYYMNCNNWSLFPFNG